jgi:hypothetical protein
MHADAHAHPRALPLTLAVCAPTQRRPATLYDTVNRLMLATEHPSNSGVPTCPDAGSSWCELFNYDNYGNRTMTQTSYTGLVSPQGFSTSTNRTTDSGWGYDTAGNLNRDPIASLIYKYDAEGRMVAACNIASDTVATCTNQAGSGRTLYSYDGAGQRVMKMTGGVSSTYAYNALGNLVAEYGGVASSTAGTVYLTG